MKKYSLYLGILVLLFACALQSCKKDKGSDPEIQTTSVTSLSLSSVLMKGNIINKGSFKVLDYGFVYSTTTSGINETIGTKVSLGTSAPEGSTVSKWTESLLQAPIRLYCMCARI